MLYNNVAFQTSRSESAYQYVQNTFDEESIMNLYDQSLLDYIFQFVSYSCPLQLLRLPSLKQLELAIIYCIYSSVF